MCDKNLLQNQNCAIISQLISVEKKFSKGKYSSRWVSQAAVWDGLVYSVNLNGQNSGTQGYALPLFED